MRAYSPILGAARHYCNGLTLKATWYNEVMSKRLYWLASAIVLIVVIAGVAISLRPDSDATVRTVMAGRGAVVQDVTFTGRLEAVDSVDVSFEITGLVESMLVGVGDTVAKGQELARLDTRIARLEATQTTGTRASQQNIARVTWQNALRAETATTTANAKTAAKKSQAVRNAKDQLDQAKEIHLATERESGTESSTTKTALAASLTKEAAYNAAQRSLEETVSANSKTKTAATDAAALAEAQYIATTQTGPSIAGLSSLEASEEIKNVLLTKSTLVSPLNGVITNVSVVAGEVAVANTAIVTIQTTNKLELVAHPSESDATKISTGMNSTFTLDAFTTAQQWQATVNKIAPAARIVEGVPTYEVTLGLTGDQPELRPGLTANITVHADSVQDAIRIPRRAVVVKDAKEFVRIVSSNGTISEVEVNAGLIGSDGSVEIKSGL